MVGVHVLLFRASMENGKGVSTEVDHQRETSFLQTVLGFVKEQKKEQQEKMPILESFSATSPSKIKQSTKDMDDVVVIHDSSVAQTSQSGHSTITDQSNGTEQKNAVTVNCIVSTPEGSFEDFTQMTAFRTAQIIVRGRTLFVNPYALIEYSDIVANVVEKSGRSCKIQLDFMDFDDLQTSLRIFCRSPATGLKERLNDPNNAVAQKKYQALRSCSVFINVLKEVVECDDIPEIPTELGAKENEAVAEWYVPSKYRKFELIPADAQAVFVNMELIKEYSPVLAESPAIFSDYCMLPQFTSAELITALNVLFRNRRTGRFHSVTLENMETLYKCAGLFDCLRPMCDSFSKGICVDAVIKGDWYRLKCMLQIQVHNRFVCFYRFLSSRSIPGIVLDSSHQDDMIHKRRSWALQSRSPVSRQRSLLETFRYELRLITSSLVTCYDVKLRNSASRITFYLASPRTICLDYLGDATRRKCREPNRLLLADILSSIAGLVRDTANVLERLQGAGLADIPMGIGTALMVAVTEARAGCEQSEAMRLIL
uniref:Uncharacterized protein n=1 Tax=Ascaris lumbricoides TaxID=6252 RepID=A0A9J2P829_ASCLU